MNSEQYIEFFEKETKAMLEITKRKNADYTGQSGDPFLNFKGPEMRGYATVEQGFLTRMDDKFMRISSFVKNGELQVKDESVIDTLRDLSVYSILFMAYLESRRQIKVITSQGESSLAFKEVVEEARKKNPDYLREREPKFTDVEISEVERISARNDVKFACSNPSRFSTIDDDIYIGIGSDSTIITRHTHEGLRDWIKTKHDHHRMDFWFARIPLDGSSSDYEFYYKTYDGKSFRRTFHANKIPEVNKGVLKVKAFKTSGKYYAEKNTVINLDVFKPRFWDDFSLSTAIRKNEDWVRAFSPVHNGFDSELFYMIDMELPDDVHGFCTFMHNPNGQSS